MFSSLIGEEISVVISSRGDNLLEYIGILSSETEDAIELSNVNISVLMGSFQKGIFGNEMGKYKENLDKVIINKRYIISCNK